MFILTNKDSGRRVQLRVGDEIEIRLSENATAGYRWSMEPYDSTFFEIGQSAAYANAGTGSAGEAIISVRMRTAGSGKLVLTYARRWETPKSGLERFTLDIEASA